MKSKLRAAVTDEFPLSPIIQRLTNLILGLPTHRPAEIRRFLRRVDGMETIAERTAAAMEAAANQIMVPGVTPAGLRDALALIIELRAIEEGLLPYYRLAYENRRAQDSTVMANVLKVWRVVQASGDRKLVASFRFLGDWIGRHHRPRSKAPRAPKRASARSRKR